MHVAEHPIFIPAVNRRTQRKKNWTLKRSSLILSSELSLVFSSESDSLPSGESALIPWKIRWGVHDAHRDG